MIFLKTPLRITKVIGLALILALLHPGSSSADVIITEFMASNNSVIDDEDGESSDWIEIYNTGPAQGQSSWLCGKAALGISYRGILQKEKGSRKQ